MKQFHILAVVIAGVLASANAAATIQNEHNVPWYNCTGKPAGNYMHPTSCNHYMACSAGSIASQMDCAPCNYNAQNCPEERLRWNDTAKVCDWATSTRCETAGDNGSPIETSTQPNNGTTAGSVITSGPPSDNRPPQEGDDCDPELCENLGYCQSYLRCDKNTSKLVKEECGLNLVWNPLNPNGTEQIHGGNCDVWGNLSPQVERRYRTDADCLGCFWKSLGDCNRDYDYQPANGTHRNVIRMTCATGLVFSQAKETCQRCEDVVGSDGRNCCGNDVTTTTAVSP